MRIVTVGNAKGTLQGVVQKLLKIAEVNSFIEYSTSEIRTIDGFGNVTFVSTVSITCGYDENEQPIIRKFTGKPSSNKKQAETLAAEVALESDIEFQIQDAMTSIQKNDGTTSLSAKGLTRFLL